MGLINLLYEGQTEIFIIVAAAITFSLCVHEFAHGSTSADVYAVSIIPVGFGNKVLDRRTTVVFLAH